MEKTGYEEKDDKGAEGGRRIRWEEKGEEEQKQMKCGELEFLKIKRPPCGVHACLWCCSQDDNRLVGKVRHPLFVVYKDCNF